jgi:hypothetical protein
VDTGVVPNSHYAVVDVDQHSAVEDTEDAGHHSAGGTENVAGSGPVPLVRRSLVPLWETCLCVGTGMGVTPRCLSLNLLFLASISLRSLSITMAQFTSI